MDFYLRIAPAHVLNNLHSTVTIVDGDDEDLRIVYVCRMQHHGADIAGQQQAIDDLPKATNTGDYHRAEL